MKLNRENIYERMNEHLGAIRSIELPVLDCDPLAAMHYLKRGELYSGPYQGVSLFEAANRILSDLVILYGVQRLLLNPMIGKVRLPFTEYEVALGVKGGNDLTATADGSLLIGEAFNVAPSFFSDQKGCYAQEASTTKGELSAHYVQYRGCPRPTILHRQVRTVDALPSCENTDKLRPGNPLVV